MNALREGGQGPIPRCWLEQSVPSLGGLELFQAGTPEDRAPLEALLLLDLRPWYQGWDWVGCAESFCSGQVTPPSIPSSNGLSWLAHVVSEVPR